MKHVNLLAGLAAMFTLLMVVVMCTTTFNEPGDVNVMMLAIIGGLGMANGVQSKTTHEPELIAWAAGFAFVFFGGYIMFTAGQLAPMRASVFFGFGWVVFSIALLSFRYSRLSQARLRRYAKDPG